MNRMVKAASSFFLLAALFSQVLAQNAPTVHTDTRFARGSDQAFGRATFQANGGNTIKERGFCWSSSTSSPSIEDEHSTSSLYNNGNIYWMRGLTPATKYYARAYAVATDGSVGYGEVIKIVTLPKGKIAWNYDDGGSDAEDTRIRAAVEEAVNYWNSLTSIPSLTLSVHYGSSTPTADCSYGGWMRVGPNSSYQKTGTIMHEALHAIGVGTTDLWYGSSSPLRSGSGTGQWLGDRATELVRFWDNSASSVINGDKTHLWPYGINGAHEDTGSKVLYIGCSLIAQAVGEDGLPSSSGGQTFGTPYYSFDQEDTIKYYIRNEKEDYGLKTSFLVETADHCLQWREMSSDEAFANDSAAWYISFTPGNQYYQFRNASTGYYMTYSATGVNGIVTKSGGSITGNTNFQLMRSRIDVTSTEGVVISPKRGYWIIHPDNSNSTPGCLAAVSGGKTMVTNFSLLNTATAQRWVILTAEETRTMDNSGLLAARAAFDKNKTTVMEWYQTPHQELTEGADQTLLNTLELLTTQNSETSDAAEAEGLAEDVLTAGKTFLSSVCVSDINSPFDLTALIVNSDFDTNTAGWTMSSGSSYGNQEVEYYEKYVNCIQTLTAMPKGTYALKASGFQRPGKYASVYTSYVTAGLDSVKCKLYIDKASQGVSLKNLMADRTATSLHSGGVKLSDNTYVPNTMASARAWFDAGYYDNVSTQYRAEGNMKIGVTGPNAYSSWWTVIDHFRLFYYGPLTLDEISQLSSIEEVPAGQKSAASVLYNLQGQRVTRPSTGIFVRNGKKIILLNR